MSDKTLLRDQTSYLFDVTAANLQRIITPDTTAIFTDTPENHTGLINLLYPYKPAEIAAAVIAADIKSDKDADLFEELLTATHHCITMFHGLFLRDAADDLEAAKWSMKLLEHMRDTPLLHTRTHLYSSVNGFADTIFILDPTHRDEQMQYFNPGQDLAEEQVEVLAGDLADLTRTYRAFILHIED